MVLAEFSGLLGMRNTAVVVRRILEKLCDTVPSKSRLCFSQDRMQIPVGSGLGKVVVVEAAGLTALCPEKLRTSNYLSLKYILFFSSAFCESSVYTSNSIANSSVWDLTETASSSYAAMTDATSMAYLPQTVVLCEHRHDAFEDCLASGLSESGLVPKWRPRERGHESEQERLVKEMKKLKTNKLRWAGDPTSCFEEANS
ncbi:regulatory-associated protein of TOR 1 [Striga asiatica]|uniref:Regulatory-associated protein of TOR 1 n=1 Tax=Striga asiatica TaxID=4170 RepID=A0A5A7PS78_STRAF|nr:regulatory-associated protein of TOR 1 [Striga asiatica]